MVWTSWDVETGSDVESQATVSPTTRMPSTGLSMPGILAIGDV